MTFYSNSLLSLKISVTDLTNYTFLYFFLQFASSSSEIFHAALQTILFISKKCTSRKPWCLYRPPPSTKDFRAHGAKTWQDAVGLLGFLEAKLSPNKRLPRLAQPASSIVPNRLWLQTNPKQTWPPSHQCHSDHRLGFFFFGGSFR